MPCARERVTIVARGGVGPIGLIADAIASGTPPGHTVFIHLPHGYRHPLTGLNVWKKKLEADLTEEYSSKATREVAKMKKVWPWHAPS